MKRWLKKAGIVLATILSATAGILVAILKGKSKENKELKEEKEILENTVKKQKEAAKTTVEKRSETNENIEKIETGSSADDFANSLNLLHNSSKKRK